MAQESLPNEQPSGDTDSGAPDTGNTEQASGEQGLKAGPLIITREMLVAAGLLPEDPKTLVITADDMRRFGFRVDLPGEPEIK